MSTYGSKTRRFLDIRVQLKWSSEDYEPPGPPTLEVEANGLTFSVTPRLKNGSWLNRDSWMWSHGFFSTPWFHGDLSKQWGYFVDTTYSDDFPGNPAHERFYYRRND